jgi:hypothetical protein
MIAPMVGSLDRPIARRVRKSTACSHRRPARFLSGCGCCRQQGNFIALAYDLNTTRGCAWWRRST